MIKQLDLYQMFPTECQNPQRIIFKSTFANSDQKLMIDYRF